MSTYQALNSTNFILDVVETGIFLLDFAQQLRCKNEDVPDIYFTLFDAAGVSSTQIRMPKLKREKAECLSKSEPQKLLSVYKQAGAAYGSVRNLVKTSNLSVSKVTQLLHSKPSHTKITLTTRKIKQREAFARFKNEIRCLYLAHVDKLAKDTNGLKYFLVRQDLVDRTVDAKGMKTKGSEKMVRPFRQ